MVDKKTILELGVHILRYLQVLAASFPDHVAELKWDCFYSRLPKRLKAMVAYLKASPHEKTYSNYLQTARETEKGESIELSCNPWSQAIDNTVNPKLLVSSLWGSSKGTNWYLKQLPCARCPWKRKAPKGKRKLKWRPWHYWWGYRRVHGAPCEGHEGCPSGGETLLSLQQPWALYPWLSTNESLEREYAVKLEGGDSVKEGSMDPSSEVYNALEPSGGGYQGIT